MDQMTGHKMDEFIKAKYEEAGISRKVYEFGAKIEDSLKERFAAIDRIAEYNQLKVVHAMQKARVNSECFQYVSGYGYNDFGRDTLEQVYANIFHTEDALVRPQITCGTHALALALAANLRPGDEMISVAGKPYDTLEEVIGIRESKGSLKEYGISYRQVDLLPDGSFDFEKIAKTVRPDTKLVTIQRSKGYQTRPSFSVDQIGEAIRFIKERFPDVICMVDNCYGEFVEEREPSEVGADLIVGSLIKNPGGGLAPTGGYIAGKETYVLQCENRLTAPSVGGEVGSYAYGYQLYYQGFFLAPHVVAQSLKGALLIGQCMAELGYRNYPSVDRLPPDITRAVRFDTEKQLTDFIQSVQDVSPVDSFVRLEAWDMPGYDCKVIMAAGTFNSGASIELSADAPIRAPYVAYFQGGLTYEHCKLAVREILKKLV